MFWISLQILSETFPILRRIQRHIVINVPRSSCTRYSCQILNDTWIFSTDFQKYWNIKFHINPSVGSRVLPRGRTDTKSDGRKDGHDEGNSRFSQFCEHAYKCFEIWFCISPQVKVWRHIFSYSQSLDNFWGSFLKSGRTKYINYTFLHKKV